MVERKSMNKLIIITGISGSGKTTLAKFLNQHIEDSVLLSLDQIKESICDTIGFKNEEQKESLNKVSKKIFKLVLEESMKRRDKNIIIEYPFNKKWKTTFQNFSENYEYNVITINCIVDDFDENWDRIIKRDFSHERHPSHENLSYNPLYKNQYEKVENIDYYELKKENDTKEHHQINLGKVIEFRNRNEKSLEEILQKIKEYK